MRSPLIVLFVLAILGSSCGRAEFGYISTAEELKAEIEESGAAPEIAECVQGMAIQDERLTDLDLDNESDRVYLEDLQQSCERADNLSQPAPEEPEEIPFAGPNSYGDDAGLDFLWDGCEAGDGSMCDALFENAPVDTEYETYGVTCGKRAGIFNCSEELVAEEAN
jgi:hypothetical protein